MQSSHCLSLILVGLIVLATVLLPASTASAQEGIDQADPTEEQIDDLIQQIISNMTAEQRVGQLFLVTFVGSDTGPNSDIARLIRDQHVGGVVLLPANENFRNEGDTPQTVLRLNNDLQTYAFRDLDTPLLLADGAINDTVTTLGTIPGLPLLIAINHEGDGYPYAGLIKDFTPVPNNLAIGATYDPDLAEQVGEIVGRELEAVGINLLLGPSLDVLDNPRPELKGYPGSRTFGGDAYWVAQMGQAYISGVHEGSGDKVATVAKHFPGQGGSDRRPDREVATVQKPLSALQQVELVPFKAVTEQAESKAETTNALMTSHVRYKGFQENPRQLTPPISLAPELQTIMEGFDDWRTQGGILVSDALGVRALKRYYQAYEPDRFPTRRVTQEAFLAGNDLLILSQFDRDGVWSTQLANMDDAINFFRQKYAEDPAFRARVDESLKRIIRLKLKLYPQLDWEETQRSPENLAGTLNQGADVVTQVARAANTLIFPGATEIADRLPSPPLPDERVLIFTDARPLGDCSACPSVPAIPADALEQIVERLYGPAASDQVRAESIASASFDELDRLLRQTENPTTFQPDQQLPLERFEQLNGLINDSDWIVFAMLDVDQEAYPSSTALKRFLDQRADVQRDKKLIVFAFNAPYFLSDTEIGKLTAYYGLYSKVESFLEMAVRTLFRELTPSGALPVSVAGVNYELDRQLEPDPSIPFALTLYTQSQDQEEPVALQSGSESIDLDVGDQVILRAGPVLDLNGHVVPDGTLVEFRFLDQQAGVELPRRQEPTTDGFATTQTTIERAGSLQLSASAGDGAASDAPIILTIGGEAGSSLATATPTSTPTSTPSPLPTDTPTLTPTATMTATPAPTPTATPTPMVAATENSSAAGGRTSLTVFLLVLIANMIAASLHYLLSKSDHRSRPVVVKNLLISAIGAQGAFLLYALGWLPGSDFLQNQMGTAGALVVAFLGGLLPFVTDRVLPESQPEPTRSV